MNKLWNIPVTWSECGIVQVEGDSIEEAIDNFATNIDHIPLPKDGTYVDGSFEITSADPEFIKSYNKANDMSLFETVFKTHYGLEFKVTKEMGNWESYDITVANSHLSNWGLIIIDASYGCPIDNFYDLEEIETLLKLKGIIKDAVPVKTPPNTEKKFSVGDIVYVSNNDDVYEEEYGARAHKNFFGKIVEMDNDKSIGVSFDDDEPWFYNPEELSHAKDLKDMTLEEFSNKFCLVVNGVFTR